MMNGITVYASNRMETLLDALAGALDEPLGGVLDPEVIVVQSKGMQRWLSWKLAEKRDVFANARFPFPNALVGEFFDAVVEKPEGAGLFSKELMSWRIMRLLPALFDTPPFQSLRSYLGGETFGLKGFQLASRIADAFDQYTLYRPGMILGWDRGESPEDWQAILWRELSRGCEGAHRAAIRSAFIAKLKKAPPKGVLPPRISIFGIPAMPKFHFDVFEAIAPHCDVRLFFMNPSAEFWGDIVSPKELVRKKIRCRLKRESAGEQHLTVGNPLLGSLGKLGRDFFNLLCDSGGVVVEEADFIDPMLESPTLLASLQSDILLLKDRAEDSRMGKPLFPSADGSVRVHAVHGPMREMEVLHDQLLDLFERIEGLEPHDIVVMAPDIDSYAPFVSAVFGSILSSDPRYIPWSLSDRSAGAENEAARAFLKVVALCGSRFGASEISEMIELPAIGRKFGFLPDQVERIQRWIAETRIRWGVDAADRARAGVPPFSENSWVAGFDRLLLGYAVKGDDESMFRGLLPHEGVEGADALLLGRFIGFFRVLTERVRDLEATRTLTAWSETFQRLLSDFVDEDDESGEAFRAVRQRLIRLGQLADESGFDAPVPVEVAHHWIQDEFGNDRGGRGFLSRGVTFCEMLPMRSIPFRVVALVGMDNGAFPRQDRPPGFDKIASDPKPGDRSLREEDRYLFLEALLSARDCFYVSYVGRSIVDNSDMPPSVLVSELVDTIEQRYAPPAGCRRVEERLVEKHPLQPFSPSYFLTSAEVRERPLFSYSTENLDALASREALRLREKAAGSTAVPEPGPPFLLSPLPPPPDSWRHVTVEELKRFFRGPAEYFLKERIRIHHERAGSASDDHEPFDLDGLERYFVKEAVTERLLEGGSLDRLQAVFRASGVLPPGAPGRMAWEDSADEATIFAGKVAPFFAEPYLEAVDVDLVIGGYRITGRIDDIHSGGLLRYRCANLKGKDRLAAWIEHLVLQAQRGVPAQTRLVGADATVIYKPSENPRDSLETLLALYWRGTSEPLPFFPRASPAYLEAIRSGNCTPEKAYGDAMRKWPEEEGKDSWNVLAFGESGESINRADFSTLAERVFEEMFKDTGGAV